MSEKSTVWRYKLRDREPWYFMTGAECTKKSAERFLRRHFGKHRVEYVVAHKPKEKKDGLRSDDKR